MIWFVFLLFYISLSAFLLKATRNFFYNLHHEEREVLRFFLLLFNAMVCGCTAHSLVRYIENTVDYTHKSSVLKRDECALQRFQIVEKDSYRSEEYWAGKEKATAFVTEKGRENVISNPLFLCYYTCKNGVSERLVVLNTICY